MKKIKISLIVLCAIAIIVGVAVVVLAYPTELPEVREVLVEDSPSPNPIREAYQVDGIGGSRFFIESPNADALKSVKVASFGATPENPDNTDALNSAFIYCKNNPGTRLVFEKGIYYTTGNLKLNGVTDCYIDGNGAEIIYTYNDGLVNIDACDCLEINDLAFDWDWNLIPLGATAKAVKVEGVKNALDFVFDVPEYARIDMFYAISECDEIDNTYGSKGTYIESYDGQNKDVVKSLTKISDNTVRMIHNGTFESFAGKKFILRSVAYGGSIINVNNESKNITFDGVKLYGGTGMGIIVGSNSSHFAIRNVFIGPNPEYADLRCISLDADAVHINDADGCFIVENCDFSKQGDDDVNINCGIAMVKEVNGNSIVFEVDNSIIATPGTTIVFRDTDFNLLDVTAVVTNLESYGDLTKITVDRTLPKEIKKGCTFHSKTPRGGNYVIRNNYFHEHRARGLLLQTSDGLVENNVFYKISHDAIKIVMDINGVWHEGTGADNILIRNNKFEQCGLIGTEIIEIGTHILDKSSGSHSFTNIKIIDNEFKEICGNIMAVNNVNNFIFCNNTITIGNTFRKDVGQARAYFMPYCVNVSFNNNNYTDAEKLALTKIARSDNPLVWARVNASIIKGGQDEKNI